MDENSSVADISNVALQINKFLAEDIFADIESIPINVMHAVAEKLT